MKKVVNIPDRTIELVNEKGDVVRTANTFKHLTGQLLESIPQKSDTETFLCHSLREKLDSCDGKTIELEESEISFLKGGLDKLRGEGKLVGSAWYYVVSALNGAEVAKK